MLSRERPWSLRELGNSSCEHGVCSSPLVRMTPFPREQPKGSKSIDGKTYAEKVMDGPFAQACRDMAEAIGKEILVVEDGASPHRSKAAKDARPTYKKSGRSLRLL